MTRIRTVLLFFLAIFQINTVFAQNNQISADPSLSDSVIRQRANTGTVTLITGGIDGIATTYEQLASDMATIFDVRGKLRVLPVVGYGSLQNVEDLLYLRGVDIGMVHSDVLRHLEQKNILRSAQRKLRYIIKLYDEPLHLLVNSSITDIQQLSGQTVIIGRPGSGNEMSALTLIGELGISPNVVHVEFEEGVEQVRSGQAAAMFVVTRHPSTKLREVTNDGKLKLLPIQVTERLGKTYGSLDLTSQDYPNFIAPGETIETPHMSAVLAVYDWQPGSPRYENVLAFISRFGEKVSDLPLANRKDIWKNLDPAAPVKGWERYGPANALVEQAIAAQQTPPVLAQEALASDEIFQQFVEFIRKSDPQRQLDDQELKKLYARFQLWQQAQ